MSLAPVDRERRRAAISTGTPAGFRIWVEERYGPYIPFPVVARCGHYQLFGGRIGLPSENVPCPCQDPGCWLIEIRDPKGGL
jgi:hypothetical protein